jgi:hypothetical protein
LAALSRRKALGPEAAGICCHASCLDIPKKTFVVFMRRKTESRNLIGNPAPLPHDNLTGLISLTGKPVNLGTIPYPT